MESKRKRLPGNAELQLGRTKAHGQTGYSCSPNATPDDAPRGWHSRGYLPHLDAPGLLQSVTFRLADSLPREKLRQIENDPANATESERSLERRRRVDEWLDAGMGCCALGHPQVAAVVQDALLKFDGKRYRLCAWCVMPNHVHVLLEPRARLSRIIQSWKSFSARWAMAHNVELGLGIRGETFWMRDYWDRYIRDEAHFHAAVDYIHENPVKAGLVRTADEWPWSSGGRRPAELELGVPREPD